MQITTEIDKWKTRLFVKYSSIAPLVVFRIIFGSMMFISTLRFILKGWITDFYVTPKYFFTYYGFDWVKPLGENGMYVLFGILLLSALLILFGLFYRVNIVFSITLIIYV